MTPIVYELVLICARNWAYMTTKLQDTGGHMWTGWKGDYGYGKGQAVLG